MVLEAPSHPMTYLACTTLSVPSSFMVVIETQSCWFSRQVTSLPRSTVTEACSFTRARNILSTAGCVNTMFGK